MEVQVVVPRSRDLHGGNGGELSIRQVESSAHPIAQALDADTEEVVEELAVPRPREKMPRRGRGMVKTNCRCGTSKQRTRAIHSPVVRTLR